MISTSPPFPCTIPTSPPFPCTCRKGNRREWNNKTIKKERESRFCCAATPYVFAITLTLPRRIEGCSRVKRWGMLGRRGAVRRPRISWCHGGAFYYVRSSPRCVIRWLLAGFMGYSSPGIYARHCRRYEEDSGSQDASLYPLQRTFRLPQILHPVPLKSRPYSWLYLSDILIRAYYARKHLISS